MGIVTDHLRNLITKQVDDHGIVVWFDPEKHYAEALAQINIPNTTLARYEGSFFELRNQVEPLMGDIKPPRLVVYVPKEPEDTQAALAEAEAAGVIMKPGQQPPSRNTRLSIVARNALKQMLGDETAASIEKQVESGKLTLADLDSLAEKGEGITKGVVSVIFGASNPQDVALAFLAGHKPDEEIETKGAAGELALLLQSALEVELPAGEKLEEWRTRLARHVLLTDFIVRLKGDVPPRLVTVRKASKPATCAACITLAKNWRLRRDLRESYVSLAMRIEQEVGIAQAGFSLDQIKAAETFLAAEKTLQQRIQSALLEKPSTEFVEMAKDRLSSFWSEQLPDVQAQWALIAVCGQLLLEAERIEQEMKSSPYHFAGMLNAYTQKDRPWSLLDTHHRHMERRYHNFDFDLEDRHSELEQLISRARHRYMEVAATLAERFLRAYHETRFRLSGTITQREIFDRLVKPRLDEGKTAYVWVDALRFEMASELAETLTAEFEVDIRPAMGTVPTITEIGMAALLPRAQSSAAVIAVGEGKLALEINGITIKDRRDRVKFLQANAGAPVFEAKLDDLLPNPKKRVRDGIRDADLVLITSQEIDALCEEDNVPLARRLMDDVLHQLKRAFRVLSELGVQAIVVAADHGYLFGDELDSGMKIDAPGGDTADMHRRVWVGRGGRADSAYVRARLADFGLGGELEIAAPWNFACFKAKGGAKAYFHGGMSPQDLIVPVITLIPKTKSRAGLTSEIVWKLIPGSQKVSTRFFSVQVVGKAGGLYEPMPPKVRVEIVAKEGAISTPISASYGFEEGTGDVQLRAAEHDPRSIEPNTLTLMITKETAQKTVTVRLMDATSGVELASLQKVELAISI